jgi:tetratricopeptide (TPR) repeat protein
VLAVGGAPGKPYEVHGWELWAPAQPAFMAGDYERAIEIVKPVVEQYPQYGAPIYNLACAESRAGHRQDAIDHLRAALAAAPGLRSLAREDSDFDPIRDDPAFTELIGS